MSILFKKLIGPLVSLIFLLNMTSVGYAETTVTAEVSFIDEAVEADRGDAGFGSTDYKSDMDTDKMSDKESYENIPEYPSA